MAELMEKLSHEEFLMWQAYYQIEPFGELRDDFRFGQICSTVANIVSDGKITYKASDFIPTTDSIEQDELEASVEAMNKNIFEGFKILREASTNKEKRVNI